jgi:hypothetical protein
MPNSMVKQEKDLLSVRLINIEGKLVMFTIWDVAKGKTVSMLENMFRCVLYYQLE